jgi:3alpha(or 20beta)-hydroxysteroid dehydrogenase
MTKTAALEYGKAGIRVNSIHPGGIDTPMTQELTPDQGAAEDAYDFMAMGRVGLPQEIASLALFLASDESSYCTGAEFIADGGQLAGTVNPFARATLD